MKPVRKPATWASERVSITNSETSSAQQSRRRGATRTEPYSESCLEDAPTSNRRPLGAWQNHPCFGLSVVAGLTQSNPGVLLSAASLACRPGGTPGKEGEGKCPIERIADKAPTGCLGADSDKRLRVRTAVV